MELVNAGRSPEALELAQRELWHKSADLDLNHLVGVILAESGRSDRALNHLERAARAGMGSRPCPPQRCAQAGA